MLIITSCPFGLLKYHIKVNNVDQRNIYTSSTSNLLDITNTLLNSVTYCPDGQLALTTYIIYYTGKQILPSTFKQNKENKTYLLIENNDVYSDFKKLNKTQELLLDPIQYQHEVQCVSSILEKNVWPYFWSEYCIKKFNSNPVKWQNELKYLLFLYSQRSEQKFSKQDLDFLYHKVTDNGKTYLRNMYGPNSKTFLSYLTPNELFILFVRGENYKSEVQKSIEMAAPDCLFSYMCFKEAFYRSTIRLEEGIIILDFILKNSSKLHELEIYNLFNLL